MKRIDIEDLGVIKFIDVPSGGAPLEIRKQWVGVEMPCLYLDEQDSSSYNVASGQKVPTRAAYVIPQFLAIGALAEKAPDAAEYWRSMGFPHDEAALFSFNKESAMEIKPVMTKDQFMALLGSQ